MIELSLVGVLAVVTVAGYWLGKGVISLAEDHFDIFKDE